MNELPLHEEPTDLRVKLRVLRSSVWMIAIAVGLLEAWAGRFSLVSDATNYLDIASAYLRRDWNLAINAYESPFFSWLLALVLGIFRPSTFWEATALRLLNFVGFVAALACFEYFFREILAWQRHLNESSDESTQVTQVHLWILGYALFFSTSLFVLDLSSSSTPDIWVAAFTYLVGGLVLRIRVTGGNWILFAALGLALGFAYLTKTFYFPMSFVFLMVALLATGSPRKTMKLVAVSSLVFTVVAGLWIATLSRATGRFTYGDVGKIAFAMGVDRLPRPIFWQGENDTGTPKHPFRKLLDNPCVFDYSTHARGTYPPGFDRTYWMEGVKPYFSLRGELAVLRQSIGTFFQFLMGQAEFGVGLLLLLFCTSWQRLRKPAWNLWCIWAPAAIACLSYTVVLVEGRYIAPFLVMLWIAAFASLFAASNVSPKLLAALPLAMSCVCGLHVAKLMEADLLAIASRPANLDWEIAQGLHRLGLQPGDRISGIGVGGDIHWARLAGVKFVSEVPFGGESEFWEASKDKQHLVLQLLGSSGAKYVITNHAWPGAEKEGWVRLGDTPAFAHALPPPSETP